MLQPGIGQRLLPWARYSRGFTLSDWLLEPASQAEKISVPTSLTLTDITEDSKVSHNSRAFMSNKTALYSQRRKYSLPALITASADDR